MTRTYPGLDLIRLTAALMVAFFHLAFFWPARTPTLPVYPSAASGWVGVEIFFVISGFVIAFSADGSTFSRFVTNRAARLYPAAWICGTITFLLQPQPIANYARTLILSPIGPWVATVYWTLAVEMTFYAAVAVFLWRGWPLYWLALTIGFVSSGSWAFRLLGYHVPVGFLAFGCYFAFGMLLYERRGAAIAAFFFAAGIVGCYVLAKDYGYGSAAPVWWGVATIACVAAVWWNDEVRKYLGWLPARTLGLMTYPLYLIHKSVGVLVLSFGILPAVLVGVLTALLILPIERAIRRTLLSGRRLQPLPTGSPF